MEPQTWLSRHYKFISAENITILAVLSDELCSYIFIYFYLAPHFLYFSL